MLLRFAIVIIVGLSSLTSVAAQDHVKIASTSSVDSDYAPLIDSAERDYLRSTEGLTRYEFDGRFNPAGADENARIDGRVAISYRNHTGSPVEAIYLRLYANSQEYAEGEMTIIRARVDDDRATGELSQHDTLYTIPLEAPLVEGASVEISISFETVIPTDPVESYGMFKYDTDTNGYALAHWLPLLTGWDAENGWNIGPVSQNGDPVYSEAAVFDVNLVAPDDLVFVTSGSAIERSSDGGMTETHFASGPSRDFVMAASSDFVVTETVVGETTVRSFALPGSAAGAAQVLNSAAASLELYNELIGIYPYEELDLVQVDVGNGAGGVEFPGLVYIGANYYADDWQEDEGPSFLEFIVVHEVAHQWFYGVVGNNQYQHAFMDESLSNYLSIVYFADAYGAEVAHQQANLHLRLGYFDMLFEDGDQIVDQPTDAFPSSRAYGRTVYAKGALAFMELRREIGAKAFFAGLTDYYADFAFDIAQPGNLKRAFEQSAGEDLDEFWSHWFNEPAGKDDFDATDLARLRREIGE